MFFKGKGINNDIPSYVLDIWEENYSPYLLPLQEEEVRNYGILDCDEGSTRLSRRFAPRNDKKEEAFSLLPLAGGGLRWWFY